ncbi:hypothetical protein ACET3X_001682 [Alternaria dauci]|uniref:NADAR domain-containing protein n=1 Tax=Alternaria dauci TaxID=48095 RepID=A0ABR3UYH6_9PLEO
MGDKQPETIEFNTSDGSNGYLSPEYVSRFRHADKNFESREQYINAAKAKLFRCPITFKTIMETTDAMEARRLGSMVAAGMPDDHQWHKDKYRIYLNGDWLKFTTSEHADELRRKLLATGKARLVYTGPDDDKTNPNRGVKENIVGRVLEDVRARLRQQNAVEAGTSSIPAPIGGESEQKRKAQSLKELEDKERAAKKAKQAHPHSPATDLTADNEGSTTPPTTKNKAKGYTVLEIKVELKLQVGDSVFTLV